MIDPISSRSIPLEWPEFVPLEKAEPQNHVPGADAEVASLYYQSSIQSLNPTVNTASVDKAKDIAPATQPNKSFWGKVKDWFANLLGIAKMEAPAPEIDDKQNPTNPTNAAPSINHPPQLEPPEASDQKYAKSVNELNREMITRCEEEIDKLREDFRNASSQKMEVLIHWKFIELSLNQRDLKEQSSIGIQKDALRYQEKNKVLQQKYFSIVDEVQSRAKTNKVLHWVNIGQTAAYVGFFAVIFATGGTALPYALPFLSIAKGGTSLAEGVLKYKNDLASGELFAVNQDIKANSKKVKSELLPAIQTINEDWSAIFKALRHQLKTQHQTAQLFTRK